jgi:hypothetical protein
MRPVRSTLLEGVLVLYPVGGPVALARDLFFDAGAGRQHYRQGHKGSIVHRSVQREVHGEFIEVEVKLEGAPKPLLLRAGYLASLLKAKT